jgi:hypothetical protein
VVGVVGSPVVVDDSKSVGETVGAFLVQQDADWTKRLAPGSTGSRVLYKGTPRHFQHLNTYAHRFVG